MLTPVRIQRADAVRAKLAELGITEQRGLLLTGDPDVLTLADEFPCPIVNASQFLEKPSGA